MKWCLATHGNKKSKCEIITRKIDKLKEKSNITTGRGRLHFENLPQKGTSFSLMAAWITTSEAILKQIPQKQQ